MDMCAQIYIYMCVWICVCAPVLSLQMCICVISYDPAAFNRVLVEVITCAFGLISML